MMDSFFSVIRSIVGWDVKSLLLLAVVFIITTDYVKNRRPIGFPPGPPSLPVVGNMFTVDFSKAHESLTQLGRKYGDVFSMRLGSNWTVVLNRFEVLKEALVIQGDSLAERPHLAMMEVSGFNLGLINSNGHVWRQQRRFALRTLKYFGLGKKSLEPVILDEFTHCAKYFRRNNGQPFDPCILINNAVSNIICSLVFGHRFEYSDKKFVKMLLLFNKAVQIQSSIWSKLYNTFPLLMRCLPGPHKKVLHIWDEVKDFISIEINKHKQNWDPLDLKDYIDCFLNEIEMNKGQPENTFDESKLVMNVRDLFVAGSETTSTTLRWALLHMADNPGIQAKVQAEIDSVIGQSRQPSMEDRVNLPYTEAVLHEVQRMGNIVPLSLSHVTSRDLKLRGYTIPKGVRIIPNLTSVMFDKDEWETPFSFNPGHFMNKEGKFEKRAAFIPFSAGKRVCLGESLAKMELFLIFTSFMQQFTFSMPAGIKPKMEYCFGITLAPSPYEICATPR